MRKGLIAILLGCAGAAWAQPDTTVLRDYCQTRGFLSGRPQKARLTPDGKSVFFLRSEARSKVQSLYEYHIASGTTNVRLTASGPEQLTPEEKARRERLRLQTSGYTDFAYDGAGERLLLPTGGKLVIYDRRTASSQVLPVKGSVIDPKWSPNGQMVSYVKGQDLYVLDLASGRERAVTQGGTVEKTHGLAEFVAQEEMGRSSGYWWSPDSTRIAYEEVDNAGVEVWTISDPAHPEKAAPRQYYPRPGRANVRTRLGIVHLGSGQTTWVDWDRKRYEYLASVRWDKVGPLTMQLQDRSQQLLSLFRIDPASGRTRLLAEERDPRWVNLSQTVPLWLPDGQRYFWISQDRLGLREGEQSRDFGPVTELVGYDSKRQVVHFRRDELPGSPMAMAVGLDGKSVASCPLTGVSEISFAPGSALRVLTGQDMEHLPRTVLVGKDGQIAAELPSVAEAPAQPPRVSLQKLGDYQTALVRPRDFQPGRKYPVVVDVYGGPHHLQVNHSLRSWIVDQWLADQGFLVVSVDNRGTPGRGVEWERAVYGAFSHVPMDDQVAGLKLLGAQFPELDLERVGMVGWSFGGYMAAQSVLKRPEVFKAAVAGAPVIDWEDYDTHYTERYLGLLPAHQADYREANLLPLASQLARPLLIVHGTADDNVYYRNSLRLIEALFRAGKPFEALPLPGITHSYTADAEITERLWVRVADFFRRNL